MSGAASEAQATSQRAAAGVSSSHLPVLRADRNGLRTVPGMANTKQSLVLTITSPELADFLEQALHEGGFDRLAEPRRWRVTVLDEQGSPIDVSGSEPVQPKSAT